MLDQSTDPDHAPLTAAELSAGAAAPKDDTASIDFVMPVPVDAPEPSFQHFNDGTPSKISDYRDIAGNLMFYICRYDLADGSKAFAPRSYVRLANGKCEWRSKMLPRDRPLYRLEKLGASLGRAVVICEGEKATDAAVLIFPDSVAMCWSGGSNAIEKTDFGPLKGCRVLLWPDNDDAGRKAMTKVAGILMDLDCDVTVIDAAKAAALMPNDASMHREPLMKWDAADAVAEWIDLAALRKAVWALASRQEPPPKYVSLGNFEMTANGLSITEVKGRGDKAEEIESWISSAFEIVSRVRDPNGNGWAKLIRWKDEDGRTHTYAVADGVLHGDLRAFIGELASKGLNIKRGVASQFADYLNRVVVAHRLTTVTRTGWHEIDGVEVFVLPGVTIGARAGSEVSLAGVTSARYEAKADLVDWQAGVGTHVRGHSRPIFAVSTAFAGPLLGLVKHDGGGFNFYGGSSTGKSTMLEAAASVYGRGSLPGYVLSWRSTDNAFEATSAVHTDTLLCLDELGLVDAKVAAAAAYQFTAGSGKGRAARDGSLRAAVSWRIMLLSTGEIRLADKLAEGKQRAMAGQAVRLIDIPADAGKGFGAFDHGGATGNAKAISDAVKRSAKMAYGAAGPAFIQAIVTHGLEEIVTLALGIVDVFRATMVPAGADGQVQRAADRFGLVAAAGEIATSLGIVPWAPGEAKAAAETCFAAWLDARGGSEAFEVREAIHRVRGFIELHGDSRFEPLPKEALAPIPNRVGYRRGEGAEREWLIFPEAWKTEIASGLDPKVVATVLADRGVLRKGADGNQVVVKINGKATRVYLITADILAGGDVSTIGGDDVASSH